MVESIKNLREMCYKSRRNHWYYGTDRKINMWLSVYITKILLHTQISANQATFLCFCVGILAGVFLSFENKILSLVGALSIYLFYLLDFVDGAISRYRKTISLKGAYYDHIVHYLIHPFIFACLSIGLFRINHNFSLILAGFSASLSIMFLGFITDTKYRTFMDFFRKKVVFKTASFTQQGHNKMHSEKSAKWDLFPLIKILANKIIGFIAVISYFPTVIYLLIIFSTINLFLERNLLFLFLIFYSIILPVNCLIKFLQEIFEDMEKEYNATLKLDNENGL